MEISLCQILKSMITREISRLHYKDVHPSEFNIPVTLDVKPKSPVTDLAALCCTDSTKLMFVFVNGDRTTLEYYTTGITIDL